MNNITLVINTLNEELNIANCINSAKYIVKEIIVCDMYSDDNTVSIAESLGAKIVYHIRTGFVEPARNYAISQATNEWVLVLDADEILTKKLGDELKRIVENDSADLVLFSSLYNYFGKYIKHGGFFFNKWPRFFKKRKYMEVYSNEEEFVHHNFLNLSKYAENKIILPKDYFILHNAYPTIEKYIQKTLYNYAIIESTGRFKKGERVSFLKVCLNPFYEFILRYIILQGFRDGKIGFIICYLKSQHTFYILLNIWFLNKDKDNKQ
jgi:glycosyltransferase involved in cell wall biosynthesis